MIEQGASDAVHLDGALITQQDAYHSLSESVFNMTGLFL